MAFTYVTLQRTYETADDQAARGTVEFLPVDQMRNGISVISAAVTATLDAAGSISKLVAATTDPATTPVGVTYRVTERIAGQQTRVYYVSVPHDQGSPLQLASLTVVAPTGGVGFALRDAADYDDSVAPTDGQVMTWDSGTSKFHPETGAGGGGVTSVNGASGAVTVTATGIGAQPVDTDLTALAALTPADDDLVQRKAGVWTNRTPTQVKTDLALNNVDNTSDANKPVSTAAATALAGKAATSHTHAAADLASGTVATARLGSGSANSTTFLRGDQTWAAPPAGGGGSGAVVFSADNTGASNVASALVTQATTAAGSGVPLIVPPGNYLMTATATLPANLTIWAPSGARFFGSVAAAGLFSVATNTTISGVTCENTSQPDGCSATIQASAKSVIFDDCTLIAPSIGVHANTSGIENLQVRNCRIQDTYFGVLTNTGANDILGVLVEGCHFTNVLGDAVEFNHPSASAPTCRGFRVVGNNIAGANTTGGTTSTGFGVGAAGVADLTISGNTIWGVLREGIHVEDGSQNVAITGNTIRSIPNSGTNRGGICIYGVGTDNVTISGNVLDNINGIGIESVYAGGADLVSGMTITGNIIRSCTSHGIDVGADGTAGESWLIADNVIRACDYGIVMRGSHRWSAAQGNVIDACNYGIGAGEFGAIRAVRNNIITNSVTADYDGFGAYNGRVDLADRTAQTTATSSSTTMAVPLLRLGIRAEGTVALHYRDGGTRVIDSLWRVRWNGSALTCTKVNSSNTTADDTNLSMVNGMLSANLTGVVNGTVMSGVAQFNGLLTETSGTLSGTVAGSAFPDGGPASINAQTGTTYTFVIGDANQVVRAGNAGAQTYTIPPNSSVAFGVGTTIEIIRYGAGTLTISPGSGVTVRTPAASTARAQYSTISATKLATDEWLLGGDLT